jgi:chromosome segregation ATPase
MLKIMKKYLILLLVIPFIFSCNNRKKEIEALKAQNDSLAIVAGKQDESIIGYVRDFNDIQSNLDSMKEAEKLITLNATSTGGELNQSAKDKIQQDIQLIYNLMQKNKASVANLKKKLKKSTLKVKELEKMLAAYQKEIISRDSQISALRQRLAKLDIQVTVLNATVDTLSTENKIKTQIIEEKTTAINTAYYIVGTDKELKTKKILTKEGGFIGIGRNQKILQDFNKDLFNKIDITKVKTIAINKKKAKLLTTHPSSSYKFEGVNKVDNLIITNAEDFWGISKYLVIVVE